MGKKLQSTLAVIGALTIVPPALAAFSIVERDSSLEVLNDDRLITAFRTDYRVPYLYPLTAPSGTNIARDWPMVKDQESEDKDHPHHRSLWLSHGDVNGYDFWAGQDKKNASIVLKSFTEQKAEDDSATFTANLTWIAEGMELLQEKRIHTFSHPDEKTLRIDITSTMTALAEEVIFGDTEEGTFAIRTDRTLRVYGKVAKATLINSNGATNDNAWGKRANWAAYSGPDDKGEAAVVAIIDNPRSFRHPTHWHARGYGLLAANPFGIHDFEATKDKTVGDHSLAKGETLVLDYTVIIHNGLLGSAKLDEVYKSLPTKP